MSGTHRIKDKDVSIRVRRGKLTGNCGQPQGCTQTTVRGRGKERGKHFTVQRHRCSPCGEKSVREECTSACVPTNLDEVTPTFLKVPYKRLPPTCKVPYKRLPPTCKAHHTNDSHLPLRCLTNDSHLHLRCFTKDSHLPRGHAVFLVVLSGAYKLLPAVLQLLPQAGCEHCRQQPDEGMARKCK